MSQIPGMQEIVKKVRARGELTTLSLIGSQAYGFASDESDYDLYGVYQAPTAAVLGLPMMAPTATLHKANVVCPVCGGREVDVPFAGAYGSSTEVCATCGDTGKLPDYTIHELGKFFFLALNNNPTVLELMYVENLEYSRAWELIIENRKLFLSTMVRRTYGGYAKQQLEKRRRREAEGKMGFGPRTAHRTGKHARHLMRLMLQCKVLLETGEIRPQLTHDEIALVRAAEEMTFPELEEAFNEWTLFLTGIQSDLPPMPDYAAANELLLELRGL